MKKRVQNKHSVIKKSMQFMKNSPLWMNTLVMLTSFLIIFIILSRSVFVDVYHYEVGDVVTEAIYLQNTVVDVEATNALRERKKSEIAPVTYIDFSQLVNAKKTLNDFFARLYEIKSTYASDSNVMKRIYAGIERNNHFGFTDEELMALAVYSVDRLKTLEGYSVDIVSQKMISGISEEELEEALASIEAYVEGIDAISQSDRAFLNRFIQGTLTANQFIDAEKTSEKIALELELVDEVKLEAGTLIATEGKVVDERLYGLLKSGEMLIETKQEYWLMVFSLFLFVAMGWFILHLFLWTFEKQLLKSSKKYGILMSLFITAFLSARFFYEISPFVIPIPAFAMLTGIMLTPMVVVYGGIVLIFFIHMWFGLSTHLILAYALTVLISSVMTRKVKQRSQIITNGFVASAILGIFALGKTILFKSEIGLLPTHLLYAMANGALSAILTVGILPFYEGFFGVLTSFKLLELSNPNRPLLKRLLIEAPGTYHHSVLVGNLAETAAHDIGANSLLTRVAAFYHDVGKLDRPFYFKENQLGNDNPHDKLPPQVSANIIKGHMSYGVTLCEKSKLPSEIIEIIKGHHGTSLIKYFYFMEQKNNPNVDVSKFLYAGPKPKTREAVILMLADSTEAAVRTLENPTKDSLAELIDKIISQKLDENQFSEANITLSELEVVKSAFINVLSGIFHERIVYPEIDLKGISKDAFNENEKIGEKQ